MDECLQEENNQYDVSCRFFKQTNKRIDILCNLDNTLKKGIHYIKINETEFTYREYNITIKSDTEDYVIKVNQYDFVIPFLYSNSQNINLNDDSIEYTLKFKYYSYNKNYLQYKKQFHHHYLSCQIQELQLFHE